MSLKTILKNTGENVVRDIRMKMVEKNLNASGALSRSLESSVLEDGLNLRLLVTALEYIFDVEEGRSPEEQQDISWYDLRARYEEWIQDKRLTVPNEFKTARDWASAMVVVTRTAGTITHRTGKPTGILSEVITANRIESIQKEISKELIGETLEIIAKVSKNGNN